MGQPQPAYRCSDPSEPLDQQSLRGKPGLPGPETVSDELLGTPPAMLGWEPQQQIRGLSLKSGAGPSHSDKAGPIILVTCYVLGTS